jgi:hypothetical protein
MQPTAEVAHNQEGSYRMDQLLREPVELTQLELTSVAGGRITVDVDISDSFNDAFNRVSVESEPYTRIENLVDNSVNVNF